MLIQSDLESIGKIVRTIVRSEVKIEIKKALDKALSKALKPINDKLNLISDYFDERYLNHEKRIIKIEDRLQMSSN